MISLPNLQGANVPIVVKGKPTVIIALHEFRIKRLTNFQEFYDKNKQIMNFYIVSDSNSERVQQAFTAHGFTDILGYHEIIGSVKVESNSLCLINYESLTMAAQFADVKLPEEHMKGLLIKLDNGIYDIRIIQFYNSETDSYINRDDIDFLIEIQKADVIGYLWDNIPWLADL